LIRRANKVKILPTRENWSEMGDCRSQPPGRHLSPQAPAGSRGAAQGDVATLSVFLLTGLFSPRHPQCLHLYSAGHS